MKAQSIREGKNWVTMGLCGGGAAEADRRQCEKALPLPGYPPAFSLMPGLFASSAVPEQAWFP